jgi:hypothetical protein
VTKGCQGPFVPWLVRMTNGSASIPHSAPAAALARHPRIMVPDTFSPPGNMSNSAWARAYFTILALAAVLIPAAVYVAIVTSCSIAYVSRQIGISLGPPTSLYVWIGIPGFALIGSVAMLLIVVLLAWRDRAWAVVTSAGVLLGCIMLCLHAALASHYPFWSIMYHLS